MGKILLILESEFIQTLLSEALEGFTVRTCNGEEASEVLRQFQPDALVLDLFLPGTDGLTLLENCRELLPPVVLPLTVYLSDYIWKKALQLGAGFVMLKPCTIDDIVKRLTDMLSLQNQTEEPDRGEIISDLMERFPLRAKPRVLSAIRAAILITLRNPDSLLTKDIYPELYREYGASPDALDQAIRRTLRNAWKHRTINPAIWEELFPGYSQCPSNGDFILTLALYLHKKVPSRFREGQRLSGRMSP